MLIVVNPVRNLNHYAFATLHKRNYESNSRSKTKYWVIIYESHDSDFIIFVIQD